MKSKKKMIIISCIVVGVLVISSILAMTVGMGTGTKKFEKFDTKKVLTSAEVKEDAKELVKMTEDTHPMYKKMANNKTYIGEKERFLSLNKEMTAYDFSLEVSRYLAVFNDLHTNSIITRDWSDLVYDMDVSLSVDSNKPAIVIRKDKQNFIPVGASLIEIGGRGINEIINKLSIYFAIENDVTIYVHIAGQVMSPKMLALAGLKTDGEEMDFTFEYNGERYIRRFKTITYAEFAEKNNSINNGLIDPPKNFVTQKLGDVLTLKVRSCMDDGSYDAFLKNLKAEIANGTKKVVIDVRGNGGGNDGYWSTILKEMGFKSSSMGFDMRYSWQTRRFRNTVRMTGDSSSDFVYGSENTKNIQLKVVMDAYTGSAAMTIVSKVRYSNIGEIVGSPSMQSPNYCGNAFSTQLSNSNVLYQIPVSYCYYKKDGEIVDNLLIPDVKVPYGEDYNKYITFA